MEELFRSGSIDQNRSSVNWPLAKALQRHGDAETGFKVPGFEFRGYWFTSALARVAQHAPYDPSPLRLQSVASPANTVCWHAAAAAGVSVKLAVAAAAPGRTAAGRCCARAAGAATATSSTHNSERARFGVAGALVRVLVHVGIGVDVA
jgi:hypothetical protein